MVDENLQRLTGEFIAERLNYHVAKGPESVEAKFAVLRECYNVLYETLNEEQREMLMDCSKVFFELGDESRKYYFRQGLVDATRMLLRPFPETLD